MPAGRARAGADGFERPLWEPDWSTPTLAHRLTLIALAAGTLLAVWRRRRTA